MAYADALDLMLKPGWAGWSAEAGARGDKKQAADYYRKVMDFVRAHPDQYEPEFETTFRRLVQKLDPAPAD